MYSWLMDSDDDDDVGRGVRRVRSPTHIYHYTNSNGYIGITSSMRIKSFARDSTHARLGFGVYFTDLAPESSTNAILMDCYHHTAFQSKASYYVKIKKSDVEYVKHPSRDVYCVLGKDGMDLNTVPHEFGSR